MRCTFKRSHFIGSRRSRHLVKKVPTLVTIRRDILSRSGTGVPVSRTPSVIFISKNSLKNLCKKMPGKSHPFTSSEEILNFEPGDTAVVLSGYIDKIDGVKLVSGGTRKLLKFVINNGQGTRIRVLMRDDVAEVHSTKLTHYQKMYITMGFITEAHPGYHRTEDVVNVEFNTQEASTIEYLGILEGAGVVAPEKFPEAAMETLLRSRGSPVSVTGFIKSLFVRVTNHSASYGGGLVVNGKHRLSVQVAYFKDQNNLVVGQCVKLMGRLKSKVSNTMRNQTEFFFEVPDFDHIVIIKGKTATEEEMALAFISATSKRYSSGELPPPKRRETSLYKKNEKSDDEPMGA